MGVQQASPKVPSPPISLTMKQKEQQLKSGNWYSDTRKKIINLNIINLMANNCQAFLSCTFVTDASLFGFSFRQFISLACLFISFTGYIFWLPNVGFSQIFQIIKLRDLGQLTTTTMPFNNSKRKDQGRFYFSFIQMKYTMELLGHILSRSMI